VGFADVFPGFGTLVILDHGANSFSLYGYLASAGVKRGDRMASGDELGRAGSAPGGPPALYFELRIDGRAVDPVEWLQRK
jgi:septal ring factor EnvC (AmiA/AmiB activator)